MLDLALCRATAFKTAVTMVCNDALAEEIAQEAVLHVWRHRDIITMPDMVASSRAWCLATSHLRHEKLKRRFDTSDFDDTAVSGEDLYLDKELRQRISEACGDLSEAQMDVFRLNDVMEYSHEEVAEELGITVQASRNRLHRARGILREALS